MIKIEMISKNGCPPCRILKPKFEKLNNDNIELYYFNISEDEKYYQYAVENGVTAVPTFFLFYEQNGIINKEKYYGINGFQEMEKKLKELE